MDTSLCGNLQSCKLLTNYKDEFQYATFSRNSMLNFSVNIYENGNLLSLVANTGFKQSHSKVKVITLTFYRVPWNTCCSNCSCKLPERTWKEWTSPWCANCVNKNWRHSFEDNGNWDFSNKSSRFFITLNKYPILRSCKTFLFLTKMTEVIKNSCHVVNLSYGEATHLPDSGFVIYFNYNILNYIINLCRSVCYAIDYAVKKHNIVFVSSVGNNGPCLTTLGAPGGTNATAIG